MTSPSSSTNLKASSSWYNKLFLMINVVGLMIHMVLINHYLMETLNPILHEKQQEQQQRQVLNTEDSTYDVLDDRSYMEEMKALQDEFQKLLHHHQQQRNYDRILLVPKSDALLPGFCLEFRTMARYLQIAVATNRKFMIHHYWKSGYELTNCSGWNCLWKQPLTPMNPSMLWKKKKKKRHLQEFNSTALLDGSYQSYGILKYVKDSEYFNVLYYGNESFVLAPRYPWDVAKAQIDVIPHWERRMGRYWIRAQMVHYLWSHPSKRLRELVETKMPTALSGEPYIGFHIRYSDNIRDLDRDFARDAHETRKFSHYMEIAEKIRKDNNGQYDISTIYLATDNEEMIAASREVEETSDWKFVMLNGTVPRIALNESTDDVELEWFVGRKDQRDVGGIVTDLEVLRQADYLVGSFQSNVYRMAAELNTAYHPGMDLQKRIYGVDIEWYEDP